jgi:hypothetical protein
MTIIDQHFEKFKTESNAINEHMDTLRYYSEQSEHITELGTCEVCSTWAFLAARPKRFITVDIIDRYVNIQATGRLQLAEKAAADENIEFQFRLGDTSDPDFELEETDLLFIDTWHVYSQLAKELELHSSKAKKFIILHDTTTFGVNGEDPGHEGLWPAVEEFLATTSEWKLKDRFTNNNGLTVLVRNP